jgi:N-ethylmaleimide reductase
LERGTDDFRPIVRILVTDIFSGYRLGDLNLSNRIVMAPMTRNRATADGVPTPSMATYYAPRAGAGLIVTEGTQPSAVGQGYPHTPGLHTDEQVEGWRAVADAVHAEGGVIFAQLMHAGRISHPKVIGTTPVAPSAIRPAGEVFTGEGTDPFETPRALETDELPAVVEEFVDASRRAVAAGLDGVELHAANGYLLQQFLADGSNQRTDAYGGTPENRARFVVEVTQAVVAAIGADRVGVRVSPNVDFNDNAESEAAETYAALLDGLKPLGLAYLHVIDGADAEGVGRALREGFQGTVIVNTGFGGPSDLDTAERTVDTSGGDLFSIGRAFIANPDLVDRLKSSAPLNVPDGDTFYGGGDQGYTDYPTLEQRTA